LRASFGFAHANLSACWIALRLTIGLEDPELIEKYKNLLLRVNDALEILVNDADPVLLQLTKSVEEDLYYERFKNIKDRREILETISPHETGLRPFLDGVNRVFFNADETAPTNGF